MRQDRIELFGVQIVINDAVPRRFQFFHGRRGNRVAKASGMLVAEQDENIH